MANILNVLFLENLQGISNLISSESNSNGRLETLDLIFRLNSYVTLIFLVVSSCLLQVEQFCGSTIECHGGPDPEGLITVATGSCWTNGTFISTKISNWEGKIEGKGLGNPECNSENQNDCRFNINYYQWTAFVLLFQALFFYLPRWIWSLLEEGALGSLVRSFTKIQDHRSLENKKLIKVLCESLVAQKSYWNFTFHAKVALEVFMLLNILIQFPFLDFFFGSFAFYHDGEHSDRITFHNFGTNMVQYWLYGSWGQNGAITINPGVALFPRVTTCEFRMVGFGGSYQIKSYMCFLLLNNINEKIYVLFWFWIVFLAILISCKLIFRILKASFLTSWTKYTLRTYCRRSASDVADLDEVPGAKSNLILESNVPNGIIFVLEILRRNLQPWVLKETTWTVLTLLRSRAKKH